MVLTQTRKNLAYSIAYQLLAIILPLITMPYVSRVLGSDAIGIYSYHHSIAAYFVLFAMLGFSYYGNRLIAQNRNDEQLLNEAFTSLYLLQLIVNLFVFILYFLYFLVLSKDRTASLFEGMYVFSVFFDFSWLLNGLEKFKYITVRSMLIKIASTVCLFLFVKNPNDVYIYIAILSASILLTQLVNIFALRKYRVHFTKVKKNDVFRHLPKVLVFFVPLLSVSLYKYTNNILLGTISTYEETGYYSVSSNLLLVPVSFVSALGNVMLPKISSSYKNGDIESSNRFLEKSFFFAAATSASMGLGISAVIKEFVPLFYGEGYDKCIFIIPILMMSTFFLSISDVIRTQFLIPRNQDKKYVYSIVFGAVINLSVVVPLIFAFDAIGAAIASLITEISVCTFQIISIRKEKKALSFILLSIPFLLIAIVMFVAVFWINISDSLIINLLLKILIGASIYTVLAAAYYCALKGGFLKMCKRVKRLFKKLRENPRYLIYKLTNIGFFNFLSDKQFIKLQYWTVFGKKLNIANPKTYNEKIQWIKLYYRPDILVKLVDKYEAKSIISDLAGKEHTIPFIGVYNSPKEINFEELPNQFVLKCTHNSAGTIVVKDKTTINQKRVLKTLKKQLRSNYYYKGREWAYKCVKPRIVCEPYVEDNETKDLRDYKFLVFDGIPKFMYIETDRQNAVNERTDWFDMDFNHLEIISPHPNADVCPKKPANFEKMKELCSILGKDFPHVRVDFFEANGKLYVAELTFYNYGGLARFKPHEYDLILGELIKLPTNTKKEK